MSFSSVWPHLASCLRSHKWLLYCLHWNRSCNSGMCLGGYAWSAHAHGMDYPVVHSSNTSAVTIIYCYLLFQKLMFITNKETRTSLVVHNNSLCLLTAQAATIWFPMRRFFFNHYIHNGFESYKWLSSYPL